MSTTPQTTTDRSHFFRFRVAAALLAILAAVDVGLAFQYGWSKRDHAELEQQQTQAVREVLDTIDVRRGEITSLNQRASKILEEKLRSKPSEPAVPSEPSSPAESPESQKPTN